MIPKPPLMTVVNSGPVLDDDDLNAMDRWLVAYLDAHEWATPNLLRQEYNDEQENERDEITRQWVSSRLGRLREHGHVRKVHPRADEYELVDDPREE